MSDTVFLDVWSCRKRKRFYIFEDQRLIVTDAQSYSDKSKKLITDPFLSIKIRQDRSIDISSSNGSLYLYSYLV